MLPSIRSFQKKNSALINFRRAKIVSGIIFRPLDTDKKKIQYIKTEGSSRILEIVCTLFWINFNIPVFRRLKYH